MNDSRAQVEALGRTGCAPTALEAERKRYRLWAEAAEAVAREYNAAIDRAARAEAEVARLTRPTT